MLRFKCPQVTCLLLLLSSCPDLDLPVAPLQADLVSMAESLVAQAGQPHSQVKDVARGAKSSGCNFSGACACLRACGIAGQVVGAPSAELPSSSAWHGSSHVHANLSAAPPRTAALASPQ